MAEILDKEFATLDVWGLPHDVKKILEEKMKSNLNADERKKVFKSAIVDYYIKQSKLW